MNHNLTEHKEIHKDNFKVGWPLLYYGNSKRMVFMDVETSDLEGTELHCSVLRGGFVPGVTEHTDWFDASHKQATGSWSLVHIFRPDNTKQEKNDNTKFILALKDKEAAKLFAPTDFEVAYATGTDQSVPTFKFADDAPHLKRKKPSIYVGHNFIGFDYPVLQKHSKGQLSSLPYCVDPDRPDIIDTLILSKILFPEWKLKESDARMRKVSPDCIPGELVGSYSLKAWGYRLGIHKKDAPEFSHLSTDMVMYCYQDVVVLQELFRFLIIEATRVGFDFDSLVDEQRFADALRLQMKNGVPFDTSKAVKLASKIGLAQDKLAKELRDEVPPKIVTMKAPEYWWFVEGNTGVKHKYERKKDCPYKFRKYLSAGPMKTKTIMFNPGSSDQQAEHLKSIGWKPKKFTPSGKPELTEKILESIEHEFPIAKKFMEYSMLQKRQGMLSLGENSWLGMVDKVTGRMFPRIDHNGAVSGRCTHSKPNLAQVTSPRKPFGKEMRECFFAPEGTFLMGADLAQIELRMLAHFLFPYDGGVYRTLVLEGDVHTYNRDKAGKVVPWLLEQPDSRDIAKTLIYATIYGGGPDRIAGIVGQPVAVGKQLLNGFFKAIPALKKLINKCKKTLKDVGYLRGLDGRPLYPRSPHAALNVVLQSAAALVMKRATVLFTQKAYDAGYENDIKQVLHVHDELQALVSAEDDEEVLTFAEDAVVSAMTLAGEYYEIRIPVTGEAKFGTDWSLTH